MKTWDEYKEYVKANDPEIAKDIVEAEMLSAIITIIVEHRTSM